MSNREFEIYEGSSDVDAPEANEDGAQDDFKNEEELDEERSSDS